MATVQASYDHSKMFFKKAAMVSDQALDWPYTVAGWNPTLRNDVPSSNAEGRAYDA